MVVVVLLIVLFALVRPSQHTNGPGRCLTGYMTDVQTWVDEHGSLTDKTDQVHSLDLSSNPNPRIVLHSKVAGQRSEQGYLKYLSLAKCGFTRVPKWFDTITGPDGRTIAETLEYLTLYGNNFLEISPSGEAYDVSLNATDAQETMVGVRQSSDSTIWFDGFLGVIFEVLKELDLRACGIMKLSSSFFIGMAQLEALYLSENSIHIIEADAFVGLDNLLHLDLSRNFAFDKNANTKSLLIDDPKTFKSLTSMKSLDFSHTKMNQRSIDALRNLGPSLERLSLCHIGPIKIREHILKSTSIRILDLSGVHNVLNSFNALHGIEDTLRVLYAIDIGLSNFDVFEEFHNLEILRVGRNDIATIRQKVAKNLCNLKVLDLSFNRLGSWFSTIFSHMTSLQLLEIQSNNINVISDEMMIDFANVSFLGMSDNPLVCNCLSGDLIQLATRNEFRRTWRYISSMSEDIKDRFDFHVGFEDVNKYLACRVNISFLCDKMFCEGDGYVDGRVLLSDYNSGVYNCFLMSKGKSVPLVEVRGCEEERRANDLTSNLESGRNKLLILLLLPAVMVLMMLIFVFRRNLRYFYVTLRNSALISMVNKNKVINDDTVFNYDVFVSYCNDDRAWVLDQLLSHLEHDCSVSLCLHERDFQVGLSILENIVSCMDRSKFIMLVISQKFLLSQWCQFEMHLAQHRLLETRREDLILILLEDIPRRLRPNNLHYLMLTKTYIVWPKNKSEQHLFWKRLKKSVIAQKQKRTHNVSLT